MILKELYKCFGEICLVKKTITIDEIFIIPNITIDFMMDVA